MPGPPPPSKSYLLKIIDSSDEEEDDDECTPTPMDVEDDDEIKLEGSSFLLASSADDDSLCQASSSSPSNVGSGSKKKKKKKKKNKSGSKKKKNKRNTSPSAEVADTEAIASAATKSVRFSEVKIREFERTLGSDVVPYDGGWPLGLGAAVGDLETQQVDEYEKQKQDRLRIRAQEKGIFDKLVEISNDSSPTNEGENSTDGSQSTPILETRQLDYKSRAKNPLFHLLTEEQRMDLLLKSSAPLDDHSSNHDSPSKRRDSKGDSPNSKRRDSKNKNKDNHPHSGHHSHHGLHHTGHHINTRSNAASKRERSGSFSQNNEHYNETFTQVLVHHVRNELEEIRFQRNGEGHTGCQCRKLDVYLLPPGGGGKKAHHRRLPVRRVKEELRKRHLLPKDADKKSRDELELLLHDTVEKESCCAVDCPCSSQGIECQADVCQCWYDSHQQKQHDKHHNHHSQGMSTASIQERCGNRNGMYVVDLERISSLRQDILKAYQQDGNRRYYICPPISPHTPSPAPEDAVVTVTVAKESGGTD